MTATTIALTAGLIGEPMPERNLASSERAAERAAWSRQQLGDQDLHIEAASADASFRSYWRIRSGDQSWIVMDAPPDRENCRAFVDVAQRLRDAGLHAPQVHATDFERGFLLLEDLGDTLYADLLDEESADTLYGAATSALAVMQSVTHEGLPSYDRDRLSIEMELFPSWFLQRQLGMTPDESFQRWWHPTTELLLENAFEQPQRFVHRDYHCGNLMACEPQPGILDFQDAVHGPVTYDLVSLLYDRYVTWPRERILEWSEAYRLEVAPGCDRNRWTRWQDLMALQRSLKVVGIFARLNFRDNKPRYLAWQPRFAGYVADLARRYPELSELHGFMVDVALPALTTAADE